MMNAEASCGHIHTVSYMVKGNSWYSYRHRTSFIFHIQHRKQEEEEEEQNDDNEK